MKFSFGCVEMVLELV